MGELESNVAVVRRLLRAFNARDDDAVLEACHPAIVFEPLLRGLPETDPYRAEEGVRRYLAEVRERWPELRVEVAQLRASGDTVVAFGELTGQRPEGDVRAPVTSVWRVRDGRAAHGIVVSHRDTDAARPRAWAPFLVEIPAEPESVADAREAVAQWAEALGASREERAALTLCVSEAVTNSILHAYLDSPPGPVRVCAVVERGDVVLSIEDEGCGMRPHPDSPGLGMGLPLMGQMAASLEITGVPERPRGCVLRMTFRVAAVGRRRDPAHDRVAAAR